MICRSPLSTTKTTEGQGTGRWETSAHCFLHGAIGPIKGKHLLLNQNSNNLHYIRSSFQSRLETEFIYQTINTHFTFQFTERIQWESLFNWTSTPTIERRFGIERSSNQNLVPKQTGQNQEINRQQKSIGFAIDGPRIVQSLNSTADKRRGRTWNAYEWATVIYLIADCNFPFVFHVSVRFLWTPVDFDFDKSAKSNTLMGIPTHASIIYRSHIDLS